MNLLVANCHNHSMSAVLQSSLPYIGVMSHIVLVLLVVSALARKSWGKGVVSWVGERAVLWGFLVSLTAILGSLFYSEIVGYEPCLLCWWQRVFLYPQVLIFATALWAKDKSAFLYSVPLSIVAGVLALYHSYVYMGGESLLPCTALGGACSKIYVMEFGYITIPSLSLTIVLYLLVLAWIYKIYRK